jgi:hypothetical protein
LARHWRELGDEQLRDGLIQCFAFTYELAHKNTAVLFERKRSLS